VARNRCVQFISGATILGEGSISLIVDVDKLASLALADQNGAYSQPQIIPKIAQPGNNPVAQL
jgi:chemotaxis protein histidine kinase CheA